MLAIENVVRLGLVLIVAAAALDVLLALAGAGHAGHHALLPEHTAHVIGLVGMVLVMAGVVAFGARRHIHRRPRAVARGGSPDAPR